MNSVPASTIDRNHGESAVTCRSIIKELAEAGVPNKEIAKRLRVSVPYIYRLRRELGILTRRQWMRADARLAAQAGVLPENYHKLPAYSRWQGIIQRCTNPNHGKWKHYGGRGIQVCERWLSFANFYADMGNPPEGMSIERVDNNLGYEPGNVVWATMREQLANRRNSPNRHGTVRMYREYDCRCDTCADEHGNPRAVRLHGHGGYLRGCQCEACHTGHERHEAERAARDAERAAKTRQVVPPPPRLPLYPVAIEHLLEPAERRPALTRQAPPVPLNPSPTAVPSQPTPPAMPLVRCPLRMPAADATTPVKRQPAKFRPHAVWVFLQRREHPATARQAPELKPIPAPRAAPRPKASPAVKPKPAQRRRKTPDLTHGPDGFDKGCRCGLCVLGNDWRRGVRFAGAS